MVNFYQFDRQEYEQDMNSSKQKHKISKELATKVVREIEEQRIKASLEASVDINDLMNAKVVEIGKCYENLQN